MIKIRPYKMGSRSANLLRDCLQELIGRRIVLTKNPEALRGHTIINWGCPGDVVYRSFLGNAPAVVGNCINKCNTFSLLRGITPDFTFDKEVARGWLNARNTVYCRTVIDGREGRGIVIAELPNQLVDAPLYTKRFKHTREYRVHVFDGRVIQLVQKRKRNGSNADDRIRSNNDWVFARNLTGYPEETERVKAVALEGARRLGINFGAFDVLYSVKQQKAVILECNSAPGLDRTSALLYAEAFKEKMNALRSVR